MKKRPPSIDGFSSRRRAGRGGELHKPSKSNSKKHLKSSVQELHGEDAQQPNHARPRVGVSRGEIDDSLRNIDSPEVDRKGRVRKTPEQRARQKKRNRRIATVIFILLVLIGGFVGFRALIASGKIFKGNFFDFAQKTPLKQDENGRSNIVLFGTSEDGDGGNHPGGNLTDSIMLVSIHQGQKNAYMVSIPRDLWVKYEETCSVGYEGKINATYMCASDDGKNEQAGAEAVRQKVGEVLGLNVHYYAHLNNKVVVDAVDALDGVEVKIESDDPRGFYDPNFDWQCNHQCNLVNYKNGEVAKLEGAHALALARARNAQGGYGLSGGNFDREKNQQKIMRAIQDKAISAGTLMNFGKVTKLIDALGDNLRTNFEIKEVRTLTSLASEIKGDKLQSILLEKEGESVVTTGEYSGQSIVRPVKGLYDYSGIKAYLAKNMTNDPIVRESAQIDVNNASDVAGVAKAEADKLESKGFTVGNFGNAAKSGTGRVVLYQIGEGNDATKAKLQELYGVQAKVSAPPVALGEKTRFVVILNSSPSP